MARKPASGKGGRRRKAPAPSFAQLVAQAIDAGLAGIKRAISDYTPAYLKRLLRGQQQGKTRQQARGKKAKEHVIRREREQAEKATLGKLTSAERAYIRRFARRIAARERGADPKELAIGMIAWASTHGMERFRNLVQQNTAMHRQYLMEQRRGAYVSRGGSFLELLAAEQNIPDPRWFYYH